MSDVDYSLVERGLLKHVNEAHAKRRDATEMFFELQLGIFNIEASGLCFKTDREQAQEELATQLREVKKVVDFAAGEEFQQNMIDILTREVENQPAELKLFLRGKGLYPLDFNQ